jgi:glycerol-3-phosphate acyltransferase PlsY
MEVLILALSAYLIGSIPFGLIFTRKIATVDLFTQGSGNIGATNVRRLAGNRLGFLTLAGDLLKGFIIGFLSRKLLPYDTSLMSAIVCLMGISAFMGHLYPIYLKFKHGGKGVATAAGAFLAISPFTVMVCTVVFAVLTGWKKQVSFGSLGAVTVLPIVSWHLSHSVVATLSAFFFMVIIWQRHESNLRRLLRGEEPKI